MAPRHFSMNALVISLVFVGKFVVDPRDSTEHLEISLGGSWASLGTTLGTLGIPLEAKGRLSAG